MANYQSPNKENWSGRISEAQLYLHEKVQLSKIENLKLETAGFALMGYVCDEGVARNQGRIGAKTGPNAIRKALGKMPNHLTPDYELFDVGDVECVDSNMEKAQKLLGNQVFELLKKKVFTILIGGGHDIAYGHYNGLKKFLISQNKRPSIGIINFDAHFDLRNDKKGANSGTPFYQIGNENEPFQYLCLGIRKDANDRSLFETAAEMDVTYVMQNTFRMEFIDEIRTWIKAFIKEVDHVYVSIDLDGFSSAYAPGVSAPSPLGFSPEIVLECLDTIISTEKLISIDFSEMNPKYDIEGQTAKLAASLIHHLIHEVTP